MEGFRKKLSKHFEGFTTTMKIAFVVIFLIPFSVSHAYEFLAPSSHFFEYFEPPIEIVSGNKVGETAEMKSNSAYYKGGLVNWWDSMYCNGVKRATQPWEDYMSPESPSTNWDFSLYTFKEEDIKCQVCGKIDFTTSRGYSKTLPYCSPFFDIER